MGKVSCDVRSALKNLRDKITKIAPEESLAYHTQEAKV